MSSVERTQRERLAERLLAHLIAALVCFFDYGALSWLGLHYVQAAMIALLSNPIFYLLSILIFIVGCRAISRVIMDFTDRRDGLLIDLSPILLPIFRLFRRDDDHQPPTAAA